MKTDRNNYIFGVSVVRDGELELDWCGENTQKFLGRGGGRMQTNVAHAIGTALGHCILLSDGDKDRMFRFLSNVNKAAMEASGLCGDHNFASISISDPAGE